MWVYVFKHDTMGTRATEITPGPIYPLSILSLCREKGDSDDRRRNSNAYAQACSGSQALWFLFFAVNGTPT